MSRNVYDFQPEITRSDIDAGIRRAHLLRSQFIAAALAGALRKTIETVTAWNRRYNQARRLENLPEYLLKDTAIQRHQIESVVSGALSRDSLSLSPTGSPSSSPAFWRGAARPAESANENNKTPRAA